MSLFETIGRFIVADVVALVTAMVAMLAVGAAAPSLGGFGETLASNSFLVASLFASGAWVKVMTS
jgi:hypothetical protein